MEKMLGPSRVLLLGFGCEVRVLLQRREPSSEGKVAGFITRRRRDQKLARRGSPRRKWFGGIRVLSLETIKSLERQNLLSGAFLSTTLMSSLDGAMRSLEIVTQSSVIFVVRTSVQDAGGSGSGALPPDSQPELCLCSHGYRGNECSVVYPSFSCIDGCLKIPA